MDRLLVTEIVWRRGPSVGLSPLRVRRVLTQAPHKVSGRSETLANPSSLLIGFGRLLSTLPLFRPIPRLIVMLHEGFDHRIHGVEIQWIVQTIYQSVQGIFADRDLITPQNILYLLYHLV
jgi:hypothetical protein